MRLCAIYCVWDDWDLLQFSIKNITPLVEGVIIIGSNRSNFGELSPIPQWVVEFPTFFLREPVSSNARESETDKRNYGLLKANQLGFTHFLTMDADEFYEPEPFLKAKELFHVKIKGLVCDCQTYFASPKLTIGLDITLVPFIHVLTPTIRHEFNKNYPYAWNGRQIRIDPTRSLNINSGVEKIDLIMHHYSWIRNDYQKKIRNSSARANLERSCILKDLKNALQQGEGYFVEYYQKPLVRATVDFGISKYESDESSNPALC